MQHAAQRLPGVYTSVEAIPAMIEALRTVPPPEGGVLSIYLDTSVERIQGKAYFMHFREGCKALRSTMRSAERARQRAFEAAVAQAEDFVTHLLVPRQPGLALFASGRPDYLFAVPLPQRLPEEFTWDQQPQLLPLEATLDDHERIAVALFDKGRARLFSLFLGRLEARTAFESDLPGNLAREERGGTAHPRSARRHEGRVQQRGGTAQARFSQRHEDRVLKHARRTAQVLLEQLRAQPFERLLIGGPEEAATLLREELPRPLRVRFAGTLPLAVGASEAEVSQAALAAASAIERRFEMAMIGELLEAAGMRAVVLGRQATLDALNEERVLHLFLAADFTVKGSECPRCPRLLLETDRCPACGEATVVLLDLRERIVERALEEGARVEIVSGEAATALASHEGLGAWTRY